MAIKRGTPLSETLNGTSFADVLEGLGGNDLLFGFGGDDLLLGGAGNDKLDGGTGKDEMAGGIGNDIYYVDSGFDKVVELAGEGTDHIFASIDYQMSANVERMTLTGNAVFGFGNAGNNGIDGTNVANYLSGGSGDDSLDGFGGDDELYGGDGLDVLTGGDGHDKLIGGSGADFLLGDAGNDRLEGESGDDRLTGNAGVDTYLAGTGKDTLILDLADLQGGGRYQGGFEPSRFDPKEDDTIEFTGDQFLNLRTLDDLKIQSVEVFDMRRGNNSASFTVTDVAAMSDDDDLLIMGGVGDSVASTGQGWTHAADVTIDGQLYEHYVKGGVDVFVDSDMTQLFA